MGQKVHPIGFRIGYIRKSDSNWFASPAVYAENLMEDDKIRSYLAVRVAKASVSKVLIERAGKKITITIQTARPGILIGKSGIEVDKLKEELKKLTQKEVEINVYEIKKPDLEARLIALQIVQQIQSRMGYKRVVKQAVASVMRAGAQGIKVKISGRLDGAEMARSEQFREGAVPLHTLRTDIDYTSLEAHTIYGRIGVKVWISRGNFIINNQDSVKRLDKFSRSPKSFSRSSLK